MKDYYQMSCVNGLLALEKISIIVMKNGKQSGRGTSRISPLVKTLDANATILQNNQRRQYDRLMNNAWNKKIK